ncbi:MAG: sigma-54-dependent Fis family transcriptional regulator, partial [Planctomycetes bacterium]|nr:sigma-54-dependent Fis family transcriptional regulator [Planctomycetota bacterium]
TEFEVVTAEGGHQALQLCREQSFDLILLDVVMPGLDGFEVCRRLKNDPRTAFVPVIFLTGRLADESEKLAAYQLGAVDYIQKPINRDELVARIRVMRQLEEVRSRLDRENAGLRDELAAREEAAHSTGELVADLQALRAAWPVAPVGVLAVDRDGTITARDEHAAAWLPGLATGVALGDSGPAGDRLVAWIAGGGAATELLLPGGEGAPERRLLARLAARADGGRWILLQDVQAMHAAEARLAARMPVPPPPPDAPASRGYHMTEFVGRSHEVEALSTMVGRLRNNRSTVLIYGESGTGKELVARALHFDGNNRSAPFIPIHCGAIAPELIESELFGHEKGAFTGAQAARDGLFRAADGGTIFLDEIAETSLSLQVKLLRVLQRGEIRPVGASQPLLVDVRILAATNRDLLDLVREGRFREDLYYRLEVVTLHLPPLRERIDDLPLLVDHFLAHCNRRHDRRTRPVRSVSRGAMERLCAYPWPGNVRELENTIERAFALGVGEVLQERDLPPHVQHGTPALGPSPVWRASGPPPPPAPPTNAPAAPPAVPPARPVPPGPAEPPGAPPANGESRTPTDMRSQREAAERQAMLQAIRDNHGDKAAAAAQLGMSRSTFYRRLKELGL